MLVDVQYGLYGKTWKGLVVPETMKHPAKFSRKLVNWIIKTGIERGYWNSDSVILDPFGGVGLGGIAASDHGIGWIGVELEPRFVDIANRNFDLNGQRWWDNGNPIPRIVQGDSRNLCEILCKEMAGGVTSPPYVQSIKPKRGGDRDKARDRLERGEFVTKRPDVFFSEENVGNKGMWDAEYGMSEGHLATMPEGVLTSPPYMKDVAKDRGSGKDVIRKLEKGTDKSWGHTQGGLALEGYGSTEGQLGVMVDGAFTSPPYGNRVDDHGTGPIVEKMGDSYGDEEGQIGKMGAVTSPPYGDIAQKGGTIGLKKHGTGLTQGESFFAVYGDAPGQIGAMTSPPFGDPKQQPVIGQGTRKDLRARGRDANDVQQNTQGNLAILPIISGGENTYWGACGIIYQQVYELLPPGGVLALVIKDFVRKKEVVPLCDMTQQLLEGVGFETEGFTYAMLVSEDGTKEYKSFFRRLYESKGGPRIDYEVVLWMKKPSN